MRISRTFVVTFVLGLSIGGWRPCSAQSGKKIGLALSGGGFRAAGLHLGVLRELERQGLLNDIDVISCVSGGCIAAGVLLSRWNKPDRLDVLENYLKGKSPLTGAIFGGILRPGTTRIDELAKSYDRDLFNGATLADIRSGPRIYFNSTNVSNGTRFFFTSGTAAGIPGSWSDVIMRDQTIQPCDASDFSIASAVAAASAFPPVFNPLRLDTPCLRSQGVNFVSVTDGGVYDNLGFGPFVYEINQWSSELEFLILSDGGSPFSVQERPAETGAAVLLQIPNIQMANIRGLGLQLLIDRYCLGKSVRPVFFSIDSTAGEAQQGDAEFASKIRTNLASLSSNEIEVLMRHGAALTHDRLQRYAPDIRGPSIPWQNVCQTVFAQGDVAGLFPWN